MKLSKFIYFPFFFSVFYSTYEYIPSITFLYIENYSLYLILNKKFVLFHSQKEDDI